MKILAQQDEKDSRHRVYYLRSGDDPGKDGYVYKMSRPLSKTTKESYHFEGWLCSVDVWDRIFERYIVNYKSLTI